MQPNPFSRPEWKANFRIAAQNQRWELAVTRIAIAVLIPTALLFYSPRLALIAAVPCAIALCWNVTTFIRRFLKGEL